jgi:proteasome beta subunit
MQDFLALLRERGQVLPAPAALPRSPEHPETTEGTTILALRYRDGILVAGDRRATVGNTVVYDRADKVLAIDDSAVLAISGSPAIGYEIARLLEISFQHYRRSQLQELSLDGKLRTLSRLLRENLGLAMQGIGAVVPILAAFDPREGGKIYFYDLMGAQFESVDFCATGSGSPTIRGALYFEDRWGREPLAGLGEPAAVALALKMLETAAEYDTATGGYRARARVYPQVMRLDESGIALLPDAELETHYQALGRNPG